MSDSTEPRDIVEISPTCRSKCRLCEKNIKKGEWRIGIHQLIKGSTNLYYYHKTCLTTGRGVKVRTLLGKFDPSGSNRGNGTQTPPRTVTTISQKLLIESEIAKVQEVLRSRQHLISSRSTLKELLRCARVVLAQNEGKKPYMIFPDSVLDSLVEFMPSSYVELMKIRGIGKQKLASYGPTIISIIKNYDNKSSQMQMQMQMPEANTTTPRPQSQFRFRLANQQISNTSAERQKQPSPPEVIDLLSSDDEGEQTSKPRISKVLRNETEDDDLNEVTIEKELSIDEIIEKRIREAESKGEVIVL